MAQSRLEKIGTIFTRVSGLLRSKAMKTEDKPIWYDVYAAFPPKLEPRFDRPATNIPIRNIFYEEDIIRAKHHKSVKQSDLINLADLKHETQTQHFLKIYSDLKAQGPLADEQVFATAQEMLIAQRQQLRGRTSVSADHMEPDLSGNSSTGTESNTEKESNTATAINIQSLFKD